jgi:ketosteroid isomerase-like protein
MAEWGQVVIEPQELIDLGDNRLIVLGHVKGSGLTSGAPMDNECAYIYGISNGQVVNEQIFLDHGEALGAAGLPAG